MLGIANESLNIAKGGGNFGFKSGEILFNIKRINKAKVQVQKYDGKIGECPLFFIRYPLKVSFNTIAIAKEDYYPRNKDHLTFEKGKGLYIEPETVSNKYWLTGVYKGKKGKLPRYAVELERGVTVEKRVFLQNEIDDLEKNLKINLTDKIHLTQLRISDNKNKNSNSLSKDKKDLTKNDLNKKTMKTKTKEKKKKKKKLKKKRKKIKKSKATKREEKKQKELASRKKKFSSKINTDEIIEVRSPRRGTSKARKWFHRRSATITNLEKFRNRIEKESDLQMKGLKKLDPQLVSSVLLCNGLLVLKKLCQVDKRIREGKKLSDMVVQLFQKKKQLPSLLEIIVNHEVTNCKSEQIILRSSKFTGLLASSVVKISGGDYFLSISKNLVSSLLKSPKDYQVDPRIIGDKPAKIKKNQENLTKVLRKFLKSIYDSPKNFPRTLHHLCFLVKNKVQEEFPNYNYRTIISAFIFLRYFSPALTNPLLFKTVKKKKFSKDAHLAFIQIAKVLQIIANKSKFGTLSHLSILNKFAKEQTESLETFIGSISDKSYTKKKTDNFQSSFNNISHIEKEIARIININMIFITKEFDQVKNSLQK